MKTTRRAVPPATGEPGGRELKEKKAEGNATFKGEKDMTAALTLNKITSQKGISIAEAANRVADLGWTPSYVQDAMTFPTDYKISKTPRDPMKQVLRSYFPMQGEN